MNSSFSVNTYSLNRTTESMLLLKVRMRKIEAQIECAQNGLRDSSFARIQTALQSVSESLREETVNMYECGKTLQTIVQCYEEKEKSISNFEIKNGSLFFSMPVSDIARPLGPGGIPDRNDWIKNIIKNIIIAKPYIVPSILPMISPITKLLYITSGIPFGNVPSFFDYSRTPSASVAADWLGYEVTDGNPGITAWIGKANAEAQNEWRYAGAEAYIGKVEAAVKADGSIMQTITKKEYKDGKWTEKEVTTFVNAEAGASVGVSVLAGELKGGVGSEMLGLEGKAEGAAGTAKAEAKGKFSVGEDGVNLNIKGEAMVSAVEGKASGTINILGLEITGKASGYAGAAGIKGKIGIEDSKFVMEGGAAAVVGGSVGVEIGFNDEGWDNFVDYITFWD